jgi:hypothetical protein
MQKRVLYAISNLFYNLFVNRNKARNSPKNKIGERTVFYFYSGFFFEGDRLNILFCDKEKSNKMVIFNGIPGRFLNFVFEFFFICF